MQGIQRAEGVFRITRDQIRCFRKTCIIKRIPLQPATIDIVEKGCKQQILEFSRNIAHAPAATQQGTHLSDAEAADHSRIQPL